MRSMTAKTKISHDRATLGNRVSKTNVVLSITFRVGGTMSASRQYLALSKVRSATYHNLYMDITSQPFVRLTCFNFWLAAH